jgi:hypothetical protein
MPLNFLIKLSGDWSNKYLPTWDDSIGVSYYVVNFFIRFRESDLKGNNVVYLNRPNYRNKNCAL